MTTPNPAALHTRTISLHLERGDASTVVAEGRLLDVRKRPYLNMLGTLRPPGVVHDMTVRLELDYPALCIRAIQPTMAAFPFPATVATHGEGCLDTVAGVQRLVGATLRHEFFARLTNDIGGARGCSHILTLLRLLGPLLTSVLDSERLQESAATGHPVFSRSIIVDGLKSAATCLALQGVLLDVYYRPGTGGPMVLPGVEDSFDARIELDAELPSMTLTRSTGRVRRSQSAGYTPGNWEQAEVAAALVGQTMYKGYVPRVQALFAPAAGLEPLRDLLYTVAPTALLCLPSLVDEMDSPALRTERKGLNAGVCYMFRPDGPIASSDW